MKSQDEEEDGRCPFACLWLCLGAQLRTSVPSRHLSKQPREE